MRHFVMAFIITGLAAGSALAQVDPDPDGIGVYFDETATVASLAVPGAGGEPAPIAVAWLIATRLTGIGDVGYWRAMVWPYPPNGEPDPGVMVFGHPTVGTNLAMNMPGDPRRSFMVFLGQGMLPVGDIVVLARLDIACGTQRPIGLYLWNTELGVWGAPSGPLHPSSGAWDLPVATINGNAPVATDPAAWGAVKSLFR